jgi:hypothetical protein
MRGKIRFCLALLVTLLLFSVFSKMILAGTASENREITFEVVDQGDFSGFSEEAYIVVKNEAEWKSLWQKHTTLYLPPKPYPRILFSEEMVICAFMGRQPTNGYRIQLRNVWSKEGVVHVEILETSPSENLIVNPVSTSPFVFASIQRTDWKIVFDVKEETNTINDYITPEFPTIGLTLAMLIFLSAITIAVTQKKMR